MLTREQFLGSFRRRFRTVDTLAGQVRIRNLSEAEKSDFEAGATTADGKLNLKYVRTQRRKLLALVLVNDAGDPLLQPGDEESLKGLDGAVTATIWDAATKHCGFSKDELEELEKNYAEATADDSPTA